MALWYVSSVAHAAIAQFAITTAYVVGDIVRQLAAPTVGNERAFRCTTPGTSGGSEPAWNLGNGATTTTGTAVFTEVTGVSTYGWAAAGARRANVMIAGKHANGDTTYLSSDHAESQSSALVIGGGGATAQSYVISVDRAGSVPPVAADILAGASFTTTGTTDINITATYTEFNGVTFNAGTGASTAHLTTQGINNTFVNCAMKLKTTATGSQIRFGDTNAGSAVWQNTTVEFGHASQSVTVGHTNNPGFLKWIDTPSAIVGSIFNITILINTSGPRAKRIELAGVDLSAHTGSRVLSINATSDISLIFSMRNCTLGTGVIPVQSNSAGDGAIVDVVNCTSANNNYTSAWYQEGGDITTDVATYRNGGATNGTTPFSRKMVSNTKPMRGRPLILHIWKWNETTGSPITATVEISSGGTLTNAEIWGEVEYLADSGSCVSDFVNDAPATILTAAANQTSSAASWTSGAGTNQKLEVTFTPEKKGLVHFTVNLAKISTTVYVDPVW